jgi:hypothetical protein
MFNINLYYKNKNRLKKPLSALQGIAREKPRHVGRAKRKPTIDASAAEQRKPPGQCPDGLKYYLLIFSSSASTSSGKNRIASSATATPPYISILANSFISAARSSGLFAHLLIHSGKCWER